MEKNEERKWEVLHREYLYREPWFTARRDHVRLPNGQEIKDYYVLEYPDWVNTIAITRSGEFVLVRQYRHGLGETRYELCAGVCEPNETPLQAAQRELLEETGYGHGRWLPLMNISGNTSTTNNLTHCFLALDVEKVGNQHLDASEDLSVHLLSEQEVWDLLQNDQLRQSLMVAPLWKYFVIKDHLNTFSFMP